MNCIQYWSTYISALLVPIIACLSVLIAHRQFRTARNKLKLDLFEKRLSIYNAAVSFISSVMTCGRATDEELRSLTNGTKEAKWLLSPEVTEYLDKELCSKGADLYSLNSELNGIPTSEDRNKNIHEQREIKNWLDNQYKILDSKFSEYLFLQH